MGGHTDKIDSIIASGRSIDTKDKVNIRDKLIESFLLAKMI